MQFKTKDLLVTVVPKAGINPEQVAQYCLWNTRICRYPTLCHSPSLCRCSNWITPDCGPCSYVRSIVTCGVCSHQHTIDPCRLGGTIDPCRLGGTIVCDPCSFRGTGGCGFLNSCGAGGSACDFTDICAGGSIEPWVVRGPDDLTNLRAELQATLKQLDVLEKDLPAAGIGSRAEAETLENALTQALDQVRKAKEGLK